MVVGLVFGGLVGLAMVGWVVIVAVGLVVGWILATAAAAERRPCSQLDMTRTLCNWARGGFGGRLRTVSRRKLVSASMAVVGGSRVGLRGGCTVMGVKLLLRRGADLRGVGLGAAGFGGLAPMSVGAEEAPRDCLYAERSASEKEGVVSTATAVARSALCVVRASCRPSSSWSGG